MRFKNFINNFSKRNRIFSDEDMFNMSLGNIFDNEDELYSQYKAIGFPKKQELDISPNVQWVEPFTNSQGQNDGGFYQSILQPDFQPAPQPTYTQDQHSNVFNLGVEKNVVLPQEKKEVAEQIKNIEPENQTTIPLVGRVEKQDALTPKIPDRILEKNDINSQDNIQYNVLKKMIQNWKNNNIIYGSLANNNKLSIIEAAKEISKLKSRQNQKAEIDEYLNDYVKRMSVPDEYKNALRHRAGSLLMAKKIGDYDKAQLWGNIKEFRDLAIGHDSKVGSAIDAQNNYIGRSLYDKYKNDNLSDDELMDKIIDSIKKYNPDETNFKEWQNKNSKIPMKKVFDIINSIMRSKK